MIVVVVVVAAIILLVAIPLVAEQSYVYAAGTIFESIVGNIIPKSEDTRKAEIYAEVNAFMTGLMINESEDWPLDYTAAQFTDQIYESEKLYGFENDKEQIDQEVLNINGIGLDPGLVN